MRKILIGFIALAVAAIGAVTAVPQASAVGTWYNLGQGFGQCGYMEPAYRTAYAFGSKVGNDGVRSRGYVAANSYTNWSHRDCQYGSLKALPQAKLTWTIVAAGYGIDSCSIGVPASFDCTFSGSKQQWKESITWSGKSSGGITLTQNYFFEAGSWGDISSITETVQGTFCDRYGDCNVNQISQKSGNIQ